MIGEVAINHCRKIFFDQGFIHKKKMLHQDRNEARLLIGVAIIVAAEKINYIVVIVSASCINSRNQSLIAISASDNDSLLPVQH